MKSVRSLLKTAGTLAWLAGSVWAGPQGLASPLPPANAAPLGYCPPERLAAGAPSTFHVLNVFLPPGPAPVAGWPVVVATGYGGGASVPPAAALNSAGASAPYWNLVATGIAVVHFGTPGLAAGRGLWYPPGHPSGRYESFRPADDNPEKSAEWALQWAKVQTLYPFDLTHVGLRGSSGGAVLAIRTAMGPERARASGSAQLRASTRVAAILAIQPPTSAWALEQGPELTIPFPKHLEQAARPGVAATQLSQVAPELQKDYSLIREAFQSAAALANNAQQPLCLVYGDPVLHIGGAPASFALDANGFPLLTDLIRQPLQHDSWFGYVFWRRLLDLSASSAAFHAANSVFAMRDVNALSAPFNWHTQTYPGGVMGARATKIGHDWLVARLKGQQPLIAASTLAPANPRSTTALVYGCDAGRKGSLELVRGALRPGATLVFGVQGTSGAAALWLARASAADYPCGTPSPAGEWLLEVDARRTPPLVWALASAARGRVELEVRLPADAALLGDELFAQAWVRGRDGRGALTNGLVLRSQ
ncbi:MAG: hypothetical protein EXS08_01340 [Planctomycetes bacterium]|nr:hypothetical protein [Planctomycetota bacterium]